MTGSNQIQREGVALLTTIRGDLNGYKRCRRSCLSTTLRGIPDPFPKKVGVDPMVKCKPLYRNARLKAGGNKAIF